MRIFWGIFKVVVHAAIGGFGTGLVTATQTGLAPGSKAVLLSGAAGALTAIGSLLTKRPQD